MGWRHSEHALTCRQDRRGCGTYYRRVNSARRDRTRVCANALAGDEDTARHRGHGGGRVIHVVLWSVALVDIADTRVVDSCRVVNVDVAHISAAHPIRRHVDISWAERNPTDTAARSHASCRCATHPGDERRCVHRACRPSMARGGHPAPVVVPHDPAAVMKGCVTPARVIDPRPSPRCDPYPLAVSIRYPAHGYDCWHPHVPILGCLLPLAIVVEVLGPGNIACDVVCGG